MPNAHSRCIPGKRVRIKQHDGTIILGKFKDYRSHYTVVVVEGEEVRVPNSKILSFSLDKRPKPDSMKS